VRWLSVHALGVPTVFFLVPLRHCSSSVAEIRTMERNRIRQFAGELNRTALYLGLLLFFVSVCCSPSYFFN